MKKIIIVTLFFALVAPITDSKFTALSNAWAAKKPSKKQCMLNAAKNKTAKYKACKGLKPTARGACRNKANKQYAIAIRKCK